MSNNAVATIMQAKAPDPINSPIHITADAINNITADEIAITKNIIEDSIPELSRF